jgi:subtilisin family serine protease
LGQAVGPYSKFSALEGDLVSVKVYFRSPFVRPFVALFLCEVGIFSLSATMLAKPASAQLTEKAMRQIEQIQRENRSRSPVRKKIDAQLFYEIERSSGKITKGVPALRTGIKTDRSGKVLVDMTAKVSNDLLQQIESAGGEVIYSSEEGGSVRAKLPKAQIESLVSNQNVVSIEPAEQAQTRNDPKSRSIAQQKVFSLASNELLRLDTPPSEQLPRVLTWLAQVNVADAGGTILNTGRVNSEGDIAHGADLARATFGVTGAGVKIGVLSNSYDCRRRAQADINSGDLPAEGINVLQEGDCADSGTDEGRAMLQIIHDLAPDSELYFATAFLGKKSFADNIRALRRVGCDVIVDDVGYFNESPFQDDLISKAVRDVVSDKAIYFSSAGNSGNAKSNTSKTWEGDFVGEQSGNDIVHSFGDSTANPVMASADVVVNLFWSDPLGGSTNDYALAVLDKNGDLKSFSDRPQDGEESQDPYETAVASPGDQIVILQNKGAENRFLRLDLIGDTLDRLTFSTTGSTKGHETVEGAFGVAAADIATAAGGRFTGGAANPVEDFSSDGPRRVFYNPDGTPITPGNLSASGGAIRNKPDLTAADGTSTTVPGFATFFGTSAAAPHAAAIAALVKSFNPALGPDEIRTALTRSALDIEDLGVDINSGAGIIDALQALTFASEN